LNLSGLKCPALFSRMCSASFTMSPAMRGCGISLK
jgi:hypothetical protein